MFSIPSVHEDTTAIQDIYDMTLTPHTEQDNKFVFEVNENGKLIVHFVMIIR